MDILEEWVTVDKTYTISQVASKLNLAPKTLRRWEEKGRFKATRTVGGQRRYSIEDLQILDAIKHGTVNSSDDLLTLHQAAALFGVTPQTIERWDNEGKIHPFITAGNTYYPKSKLSDKINTLKANQFESPTTIEPSPLKDPAPTHIPLTQELHKEKNHTQPLLKPKTSTKISSLTPLTSSPTPPNLSRILLTTTVINALLTILLIAGYHTLTSQSPTSPQGKVQGITSQQSPLDNTLASIFDTTGNLTTPGKIETRSSLSVGTTITFSPSAPPDPTPGTIYYDAGTQTLKIFTKGKWYNFPTANSLPLSGNTIVKSGQATLIRGTNTITITDPDITTNSHITTTFLADYAPAKKYWITQSTSSFTLHTDFPVANDSNFTYLILTPNDPDNTATTSGNTQ